MKPGEPLPDTHKDVLEELIHLGEISDATDLGIARQVMTKGVGSLSEKQTYVFESRILPLIREYERDAELERLIAKDHT